VECSNASALRLLHADVVVDDVVAVSVRIPLQPRVNFHLRRIAAYSLLLLTVLTKLFCVVTMMMVRMMMLGVTVTVCVFG